MRQVAMIRSRRNARRPFVAAMVPLVLSCVSARADEGPGAVAVAPTIVSAPTIDPTDERSPEVGATSTTRVTPLVAPVRYRDHVMTTAQAEGRFHTEGQLGATAFFGFGNVASSVGKLPESKALPAGGLGLRFKLTRQFPMHMRFDYAWGTNGNLVYFSVGEAF